jgi:hypothetical protein
MRFAVAIVAALGIAPMQCAHKPDPDLRREEAADDALWDLAQSFRAQGNEAAARETLRYLAAKFPSSRHAAAARAESGGTPPAEGPRGADGG